MTVKKKLISILEESEKFWNKFDLVGWFYCDKYMAFPILEEKNHECS